jgi:mRNA-degrading endonuclease toxin of MazEF toxin-antitoxin module
MMPRQGEIYLALLEGPRRRPAIVISKDVVNAGKYVLAVFCTTARLAERLNAPSCVAFRAGEAGLTETCVAQAESLTVVSKDDLDLESGPLGTVSTAKLREVIKAIGYVLGADCELG